MTRLKSFVQALIGVGLLLGLTILLIGLFASANKPQSGSRVQQTEVPAAEATANFTPEFPQVQPTLIPVATPTLEARPAGILYESADGLYWQPVDEQGKATAAVARVPIDLAAGSKIGKLFPAPDGSQVVHKVDSLPPEGCCEFDESLYIFSPPNGQPRQIVAPGSGLSIADLFGWHPDGTHLLYGTEEGVIWLFNVNTGEYTPIAEPQKWANLPYAPAIDGLAFSPDGQRLIVSFTLTGDGYEVWIAKADGSEPKKLFETPGWVYGFAWSPDGNQIAFLGQGLEIMSPDGQDRKTLSQSFSGGWGFELHWSPDSRFIAFTAREEPEDKSIRETEQAVFQGHKVHIVDTVTGEERRLVSDEKGGDIEPAWSPDGKRIAFLSNRSGASEVWVTSLDGTELYQLTSDGQPKRWAPAWLTAPGR